MFQCSLSNSREHSFRSVFGLFKRFLERDSPFQNISENTAKHELSVITDFAVCYPLLPTDKQFVIYCYRLRSSAIPCYRLIPYPRQSGWGVIDTLMSMKRLAWPSSQHEMTMERSCLQTRQTNLASRAQCCITDAATVQGWVSRVWLMIWNFDVKFWNLKLCNFQNLNKNSQKTREKVTKLKKCGKMELFQKFARFFRIKWNFR